MFPKILITDGGPHPAEKWAVITAGAIIDVAESARGKPSAIEGRKLELKIIDILEGHHAKVQEHERGAIKKHGVARLEHPIDPTEHLDTPFDEIVAAAKGTMFESYFAKPEVRDSLRNVLGQHFATSMHIERSWHADRNPADPKAVAFMQKYHGGPTPA